MILMAKTVTLGILYPILGFLSAVVLDGNAMIPLGVAAGLLIFVWRISSKWQRVIDRLDDVADRMEEVEKALGDLPCGGGAKAKCPVKAKTEDDIETNFGGPHS